MSYSFLTVSIEFKSALFTNQDFLFTSIYSDTHIYLINVNMQFIHVQNDSDWSIHIFLKNSLEKIIEMKEKQYYYVDSDLHDLIAQKSAEDSESNILKLSKTTIVWQNSKVLLNIINENISISFRIQIHQNANSNLIDQVVARYSDIWSEIRQVVNILKKYWMQIHLKNNWKIISTKLKHKSYSVSVNKHIIINKTFNKLHNQKKTYWI